MSRIRCVVDNYLTSQARGPGIDSHQHQTGSWHIWRHVRKDIVFSCNLRCRLIFLHFRSRTYRVASLRAGPVGRISYNLYFDCKYVRYVICDLINEYKYFSVSAVIRINAQSASLCSLCVFCVRFESVCELWTGIMFCARFESVYQL